MSPGVQEIPCDPMTLLIQHLGSEFTQAFTQDVAAQFVLPDERMLGVYLFNQTTSAGVVLRVAATEAALSAGPYTEIDRHVTGLLNTLVVPGHGPLWGMALNGNMTISGFWR